MIVETNHVNEAKMEGRIEVTGRRGRRRKQLLDDRLTERIGCCKLKNEALDRTQCRIRSVRGYGPVVRQATE